MVPSPVLAVPQPVLPQQFTVPTADPGSAASDVDRLKQLVDQHAAANSASGTPGVQDVGQVQATSDTQQRTIGDSILESIVNFKSGYTESLGQIEGRLQKVADMDPHNFGAQMTELVTLQMDVARWSMSVTGVDNASKAATNTVKELSRGG